MKIWFEKIWRCRAGSLNKPERFLMWDSFSAHLVDSAKRQLRENNTTTAVIPGGLTSVVQPLDVCLNKPFKDRLRQKWCTWIIEGEKTFTAGGNIRAAPLPTICTWIKDSWDEIPRDMVARSFKKCGISNAMDGTEDDMLWESDCDDGDGEDEPAEPDVYDDQLTAEQWQDLFGDSDEGEDFAGF